uniref:Uncharacterized protein n=1 Tax=Arundo donax TaxID=35708 RepID=A0A0A9CSY0_ARUDO
MIPRRALFRITTSLTAKAIEKYPSADAAATAPPSWAFSAISLTHSSIPAMSSLFLFNIICCCSLSLQFKNGSSFSTPLEPTNSSCFFLQ